MSPKVISLPSYALFTGSGSLMTERIEYKLLSLTYKVLTTTQPPYLHNVISIHRPHHITSHHMVKTDAGLNGLYIREITIYIRLYYYMNY